MKTFKFKGILTNQGFELDQYIQVDEHGKISSIQSHGNDVTVESFAVYALPGFQNAHSHAFQYAMAGLAERHSTSQTPDDFWSWREAMYALALKISPDDLEAIATLLYAEMLRHGYTNVAEFHYVHHDQNGMPYGNLAEMGERLVAAATKVGIGITLVPIFYQKGGFGKPATEGQKRFISPDIDAYLNLLSATEKVVKTSEFANLGIGIHSMRGVDPLIIKEIAKTGPQDLPFHIHISEQLKEVEDSLTYLGKRPVEWFLEHIDANERFHLVHATHLTEQETDDLARSKANVVLCPSTEGNLGDGIFPLRRYQMMGGNWSIGTDSHVGLNPFEELRVLDYGQRLISHKRNTFYSTTQGDSGLYALEKALINGRKAMGNESTAYFKVGDYLNAVLIDASSPLIASSSTSNLASTVVYCSDISMQYGTISRGKLVVKAGCHFSEDENKRKFIETSHRLKNRI